MANFHIVGVRSDSVVNDHGVHAYKDVADTLYWGLSSLGHKVTSGINSYIPDHNTVNIFLGSYILAIEGLEAVPRNAILYNFEPMASIIRRAEGKVNRRIALPDRYKYQAENFVIWDYSKRNLPFWDSLCPTNKAKYVPVGYAPILERIGKETVQDIDVLIYGTPTDDRIKVFKQICDIGVNLRVFFAYGVYGQDRDQLIARSKIILNIKFSDVFEILRVSYLLANRKAVVANFDEGEARDIEPGLDHAIKLVHTSHMAEACLELLNDEAARRRLETTGYAIFRQRDIRTILQAALSE
jgi:hypothetical protein